MAKKRRSAEFWRGVIEEYERSGGTQESFAAKRRLNVGTLRSWLYRIRRERRPGKRRTRGAKDETVRFVEVKAAAGQAGSNSASRLDVEFSRGIRLRFGPEVDATRVAEVVGEVASRLGC